jgi:LAS superfamily LD-carboxypeptidase LdcB
MSEPPLPLRIQPNARNAQRVQAAWEQLYGKPRLVLKAEYPERPRSRQQAARKLVMGLREYEYHLRYAVERVAKEFADVVRA